MIADEIDKLAKAWEKTSDADAHDANEPELGERGKAYLQGRAQGHALCARMLRRELLRGPDTVATTLQALSDAAVGYYLRWDEMGPGEIADARQLTVSDAEHLALVAHARARRGE